MTAGERTSLEEGPSRARPWPLCALVAALALTLAGCAVYLQVPAEPTSTPTVSEHCWTLYPQCHPWETASDYAGNGVTCFIGRIYRVYHDYDDLSGHHVWTAYFDPRAAAVSGSPGPHTIGLRLISVEHDISDYEGLCVAVIGNVPPPIEGYTEISESMVDANPDDGWPEFSLFPCPCP